MTDFDPKTPQKPQDLGKFWKIICKLFKIRSIMGWNVANLKSSLLICWNFYVHSGPFPEEGWNRSKYRVNKFMDHILYSYITNLFVIRTQSIALVCAHVQRVLLWFPKPNCFPPIVLSNNSLEECLSNDTVPDILSSWISICHKYDLSVR